MTANLNENTSSSECWLSSAIQGSSRGVEKGGSKTSRSRRSQRIGGRKNFKQKESEGSSEVLDAMEDVYGRA